jgi:EAL domain-containing protein (putative c-di-GMP-specific phosphodiesterase class I)
MGLIVPIGRWVLETACRHVRTWQRRLPPGTDLILSVNVSALQFRSLTFIDDVADILVRTGLDPRTLKLEITESVLVHETHGLFEALERMRKLGVKLAIDDFGTGYASLSYIKRFRVDAIKIDRSFVEELGKCAESTAIVSNVISLARSLGLSVTGEGIETEEQWRQLQNMGCDFGQGYLFSRPLPAEQVERLLGVDDERPLRELESPLRLVSASLDPSAWDNRSRT